MDFEIGKGLGFENLIIRKNKPFQPNRGGYVSNSARGARPVARVFCVFSGEEVSITDTSLLSLDVGGNRRIGVKKEGFLAKIAAAQIARPMIIKRAPFNFCKWFEAEVENFAASPAVDSILKMRGLLEIAEHAFYDISPHKELIQRWFYGAIRAMVKSNTIPGLICERNEIISQPSETGRNIMRLLAIAEKARFFPVRKKLPKNLAVWLNFKAAEAIALMEYDVAEIALAQYRMLADIAGIQIDLSGLRSYIKEVRF